MRLIDADDFFARMENDTDLCAEMETDGLKALKKYLDMQSTTYDIDKVIEELESELKKGNIAIDFGEFRLFEIVKQGGVSDGCVWKKSKDYPFDWLVGCDGCEVNHRQGDYCPRCGKKIKVVD